MSDDPEATENDQVDEPEEDIEDDPSRNPPEELNNIRGS